MANFPSGYIEKHHILPKSLGGSNEKANIVKLTAREHFICHRLLARMTIGHDRYKMVTAAYSMIKKRRKTDSLKVNSRVYSRLREDYSKHLSERMTPEYRMHLSIKLKGYKFGPEHGLRTIAIHTGMKRSIETKERIRAARTKQVIRLKEWTLRKPDGTELTVTRLKEFCQANKLGLSKLLQTQQTCQPVNAGYSKGWSIVKVTGGHK